MYLEFPRLPAVAVVFLGVVMDGFRGEEVEVWVEQLFASNSRQDADCLQVSVRIPACRQTPTAVVDLGQAEVGGAIFVEGGVVGCRKTATLTPHHIVEGGHAVGMPACLPSQRPPLGAVSVGWG